MPDLSASKPTGDLTLIRSEQRVRNTQQAVYMRTFFRDASGVDWYFDSAAFRFDLKPLEPEPVQLISVDGELHFPPKKDGGEPIKLTDRIKAAKPDMEQLKAILHNMRMAGEISARLGTVKLPDGTDFTF